MDDKEAYTGPTSSINKSLQTAIPKKRRIATLESEPPVLKYYDNKDLTWVNYLAAKVDKTYQLSTKKQLKHQLVGRKLLTVDQPIGTNGILALMEELLEKLNGPYKAKVPWLEGQGANNAKKFLEGNKKFLNLVKDYKFDNKESEDGMFAQLKLDAPTTVNFA